MALNDRLIKALRPPTSGNRLYFDGNIPGFAVRITAQGAIAFVLDYRFQGRQRRYTIGSYPEWSAIAAREEALNLWHEIRNGSDPLAERERERGEPTMAELGTRYLEEHALVYKRPGSIRNDKGILRNIIVRRLGRLRVRSVNRSDIEKLHASLKATPYHANRVLALLSKMFTLAVGWKLCDDNPARGVERYHEDRSETWLRVHQLRQLERALADYRDQEVADAIRLLVLTGARESEVLTAEWSMFDLERGVWTKPSHHTKEKKTEHVPLNRAALSILHRMTERRNGNQYLFPGQHGHRVTLQKPWIQICKSAGLAEAYETPGKHRMLIRYRPTVRIHDLRHTFASHLVNSGESLYSVGKLLGHTSPQTTARYAHVDDKALRSTADVFAKVYRLRG
jgi:integrase